MLLLVIIGLVTTNAPNAKTTEIENKVPDTSHFINAQEFNRLTKTSFDARIKEAKKEPCK